jgi:hypothetical protein
MFGTLKLGLIDLQSAPQTSSITDPGCLTRILIFYPSRIPDPKTSTKERGEKKFFVIHFCSHKFHKLENYSIFEMLKKKIWPSFQRII